MDESKIRTLPTSIKFAQFYALCERYASYGVAAIMTIFLNERLGLSEDEATGYFHYFFFASYFFAIIGALIADNWLGRFNTLLIGMSIIGGIGTAILGAGTILSGTMLITLTVISFVLISFSLGCFEPNIPSFCGDQYRLPAEAKGFQICIGFLFVMQNGGRILAVIIGPLLRTSAQCFGNDCYLLIFGILFCVKLLAIVTLLVARKHSVLIKSGGNMMIKVLGCIWTGVTAVCGKNKAKKSHWLDYAEPKYGANMVKDTKLFLNIVTLLPPLIFPCTLFFQQASRWVFQARNMDGSLGSYSIRPDQVPLVNSISVVILVPACQYIFFPLMARIGIRSHLQIVTCGGILAATSFVLASILQFQVDQNPMKLHMALQIPQHLLLALGEIFIQVPFQQFCYTQAPASMKSVIQAMFNIVIGCGNLIVALVTSNQLISDQAYEFLLFAGIVYIAMVVFAILAFRYRYVHEEKKPNERRESALYDEKFNNTRL